MQVRILLAKLSERSLLPLAHLKYVERITLRFQLHEVQEVTKELASNHSLAGCNQQ
jgi:hypothetical protein